jgi:hypothetical protein
MRNLQEELRKLQQDRALGLVNAQFAVLPGEHVSAYARNRVAVLQQRAGAWRVKEVQ